MGGRALGAPPLDPPIRMLHIWLLLLRLNLLLQEFVKE